MPNPSRALTAFILTFGTILVGLPLMISVSTVRPSNLPVAPSNGPTFCGATGGGTGRNLWVFLMFLYACSMVIVSSARASGEYADTATSNAAKTTIQRKYVDIAGLLLCELMVVRRDTARSRVIPGEPSSP